MSYIYFFNKQDNIHEIKKQFEDLENLIQISLPIELKLFYEQYKVDDYDMLSNESLSELLGEIGYCVGFFIEDIGLYRIEQFFQVYNFGWMKERDELLSIGCDVFHSSGLYICIKGVNFGKVYSYEFGPYFEDDVKQFDKFIKLADSFLELLDKLRLYTYDEEDNLKEVHFDGKSIILS